MESINNSIFEEYYNDNYKKLYLMALSILKNPQHSEDAVQNAILKAYEKINTLNNKKYFSTWVTRILLNECYMVLRKNKSIPLSIEELKANDNISFNDTQWKFFEMISGLERDIQKIMILRYYDRMELSEISNVLKMPLHTIKNLLYRKLNYLKETWREEG